MSKVLKDGILYYMDISTIIDTQNFETALKLATALFLGMSLGIERAIAGKTAGMRTYGLVTMGSALFVIIGVTAGGGFGSPSALTESIRMSAQVITGIGFLGAGLIFFNGGKMNGVTTAAGIWVASGIGMAVGYGLYFVAVTVTIFALLVFTVLWYIESQLKKLAHFDEKIDGDE